MARTTEPALDTPTWKLFQLSSKNQLSKLFFTTWAMRLLPAALQIKCLIIRIFELLNFQNTKLDLAIQDFEVQSLESLNIVCFSFFEILFQVCWMVEHGSVNKNVVFYKFYKSMLLWEIYLLLLYFVFPQLSSFI